VAPCSRSLALQWLLRRQGIHTDLRIGVRKDEEALVGHACWRRVPLTESAEIEGRFLPLVGETQVTSMGNLSIAGTTSKCWSVLARLKQLRRCCVGDDASDPNPFEEVPQNGTNPLFSTQEDIQHHVST